MKTKTELMTALNISSAKQKLLSKEIPKFIENAYQLGLNESLPQEGDEKFKLLVDRIYYNWAPDADIVVYRADAESLVRLILSELKK